MITISDACIGCFMCVGVCPTGVLKKEGDRIVVTDAECLMCLACEDACPVGAIKVEGN